MKKMWWILKMMYVLMLILSWLYVKMHVLTLCFLDDRKKNYHGALFVMKMLKSDVWVVTAICFVKVVSMKVTWKRIWKVIILSHTRSDFFSLHGDGYPKLFPYSACVLTPKITCWKASALLAKHTYLCYHFKKQFTCLELVFSWINFYTKFASLLCYKNTDLDFLKCYVHLFVCELLLHQNIASSWK